MLTDVARTPRYPRKQSTPFRSILPRISTRSSASTLRFCKLTAKSAEVIGVSGNYVKTQKLHKESHKLPFTLLADEKSHLKQEKLIKDLKGEPVRGYVSKADQLAWVVHCKSGHAIDIACLRVGQSRVLHMPGELFVEYQLAAKKMRPDLQVAMAAYGDYGPAYMGTTKAYSGGGTKPARGPGASRQKSSLF
jgi:hypothetical protein